MAWFVRVYNIYHSIWCLGRWWGRGGDPWIRRWRAGGALRLLQGRIPPCQDRWPLPQPVSRDQKAGLGSLQHRVALLGLPHLCIHRPQGLWYYNDMTSAFYWVPEPAGKVIRASQKQREKGLTMLSSHLMSNHCSINGGMFKNTNTLPVLTLMRLLFLKRSQPGQTWWRG